MHHLFKESKLNSFFRLTDSSALISQDKQIASGSNHILWNRASNPIGLAIGDEHMFLNPNQITTATDLQTVAFDEENNSILMFSFNKAFYCLHDHEEDISCSGIIFHGTTEVPVLSLDSSEQTKLEHLLAVFIEEFETKDHIQEEMLQMLLTRLIIKCTRLAKTQIELQVRPSHDLIKEFRFLVDKHFKTIKHVGGYADLLYKSPKTLANIFLKQGASTPLQVIHDRIVEEAKRLLIKTDKSAKEVAYDLGFQDPSSFNKLFKKVNGCSPIEFKKSKALDN